MTNRLHDAHDSDDHYEPAERDSGGRRVLWAILIVCGILVLGMIGYGLTTRAFSRGEPEAEETQQYEGSPERTFSQADIDRAREAGREQGREDAASTTTTPEEPAEAPEEGTNNPPQGIFVSQGDLVIGEEPCRADIWVIFTRSFVEDPTFDHPGATRLATQAFCAVDDPVLPYRNQMQFGGRNVPFTIYTDAQWEERLARARN